MHDWYAVIQLKQICGIIAMIVLGSNAKYSVLLMEQEVVQRIFLKKYQAWGFFSSFQAVIK